MRKHKFFAALCLLMAFCTQWSCTEDYEYTKNEPKWMGESLYATLKGDKRFTIYLQMLQRMDSAYVAVLDKTGSRTLFVPDDDAFKAFFQSNPYGYNSVADMPTSLISEFLKYYTLENAYVTTMLGYSENYTPGDCLRRYTTFNNTDTIPYVDNFPDNPQFAKFRGKKMYLSSPGNWTLTNFTQLYFSAKAFTADDFNKLYPNRTWNNGDVYIFDAKIVDKDIISKNGYIHVVDKVVLPPKNMYEHLRDNEDISIFRKLVERFCEPVYDAVATKALWDRNPGVRDSVYNISFFYVNNRSILDEYGNSIEVEKLNFSPAINGSQSVSGTTGIGDPPRSMPVIFAPTDDVMRDYLQNSMLKVYGTWENVPDNIVSKFLKTHFKKIFTDVFPSRLGEAVEDDKGDRMFPNFNYTQDIAKAEVCRNGLVYTTNRVIVPRDFNTVVAPIMTDVRTTIVNWIVNAESNNGTKVEHPRYNYYLSSLENRYIFFVPVDAAFSHYKDPYNQIADLAENDKKWMKFAYSPQQKNVGYHFVTATGDSVGPLVSIPVGGNSPTLSVVQNRLRNIMDYHIVVGDIDNDQVYVTTKGGSYIKIDRSTGQMRLQGAGNIEAGTYVNIIDKFEMGNGTVYIVDKRIEHTLNSQYNQIQTWGAATSDCSEFLTLLSEYNDPDFTFWGDSVDTKVFSKAVTLSTGQFLPEYKAPLFASKDDKNKGVDIDIPFIGSFDYTIFVPTNAAITEAYAAGIIKRTSDIKVATNRAEKIEDIKKVIRYLKYHFVDKSLFTEKFYNAADKNASKYALPNTFTTSAKSIAADRMLHTINIDWQGGRFVLTDNFGREARTTVGDNGVITTQYRLSNNNLPGGMIGSTSRAVMYRIDHALNVH